jgi:uncharacterized membrane protein
MECLTAIGLFAAALALAFAAVAHRRVRAAERAIAELRAEVARRPIAVRPAAVAPPSAAAAPSPPVAAEAAAPAEPAAEPLTPPLPALAPPPIEPAPPPPAPPRPGVSLEERLGARLPVWIGSIALALAGAFLVKYSFEQGWLSPAVRVAVGIAFGLAMLAGGEGLRRSSPRVSQGLSAAGIADLFACLLAGTTLYGLISPAAGFALIALTAAVAVALSLRQGPMVALIGLVGGFLAPYLIHSGPASARNLFAYLLLLEVGFLFAARRRGWTALAGLANACGLLWVVAWLAGPFRAPDGVWLCLFLVLSAGAGAAAALAGRREARGGGAAGPLLLARGTLALGLAALALVAGCAGYSPAEWAFLELLAAAVLVLGLLDAELAGLAWVAAGVAAVLLVAWGWKDLAEPLRYLRTALVLGLLFAGAGQVGAWVRPRRGAPRPGLWGALSAAAGVAFFLLAYGATRDRPTGIPWGALALALALLYIGAAYAFVRRRAAVEGAAADLATPLAAVAVAATTFVSLAVPLELERAWLAVAWALEVPALLWLAGRFRLPVLTALARGLAALVGLRLFYPGVLDYPIGRLPVVNWLLYGYGVPLAAFAGGSVLARRGGDGKTAAGLELEALAFAWALATLEVRQAFHPGEPGAASAYLAELGTLALAWILLGWGAFALGRRLGRGSLCAGGLAVAWVGLLGAALGPGLAANPLWEHRPVGETPVANVLLWAFGLPAAALAAAARELGRGDRSEPEGEVDRLARLSARAFSIAALAGLFVLVTLEVRQAFRGTYLDAGTASGAERYAYSAAWVLFATALLVLGIARRGAGGRTLRYASLAVMMIAVAKVFLYDTSNLGDLYRVFSFLGLGASLLLLAFLYQRFVFREGR